MGSAMSRCHSTRPAGATSGLTELGQKILDNQPNWLITPSRWRTGSSSHHPVRYRAPTPYPKDDRQRLPTDVEDPTTTNAVLSEKATIVETAVTAKHVEVAEPPRKQQPMRSHAPSGPHIQFPQPAAAVTITWERHSRLNRFERIS
ncbi:hypothetical protein B0H67DRAFT_641707 [Lasiosphaeris hirsuta]|uniref:Uncharacterized protein n=1 Tax=Lasiosphaeris hirsuta TaxID=260670 RepID=A0AA40B095_9PEZI|nr:hypothetical protein B0H67DRAFT_641707 [Lasiosphaeris hirsuta]